MRRSSIIKLVGLALLAVILWRTDLSAVGRTLAGCRWDALLASLGLAFLVVCAKGWRWHLLLSAQGLPYTLARSIRVYFIGLYLGLATPGKLGELARITYLCGDVKASAGLAFSSILIDRVFDFYALLVIGLLACFHFHVAGGLSALFLAIIAGLAALPLVLLNPAILRRIHRAAQARLPDRITRSTLLTGVDAFIVGVERIPPQRWLVSSLATAVAYLLLATSGYLATQSLHIPIGFLDAALALGAGNLLSLLPITIAGIGTRDAVFVLVFGVLGLTDTQALAYSALILLIFYLGPGLVGLAAILGERSQGRAAASADESGPAGDMRGDAP